MTLKQVCSSHSPYLQHSRAKMWAQYTNDAKPNLAHGRPRSMEALGRLCEHSRSWRHGQVARCGWGFVMMAVGV